MKRSVAVTIAGQRISLKSDADETYVRRLAEFVDARMRELSGAHAGQRAGTAEVAVLTALRIADELFREREQRADLRRRMRLEIERMLEGVAQAESTKRNEFVAAD